MTSHHPLPKKPEVVQTCQQLRQLVQRLKHPQRTIGLIPTMGALHEGHLSLVRAAQGMCDASIVTIFVNPLQFAPHEDYQHYPRTLADDLEALSALGVDAVFCPPPEQMYPPGFSTSIDPPKVAGLWEGAHRPDHFRGVVTVVLKLFLLASADIAFFGQKDYQQARVIMDLVEDLNVPIRIELCPIVRESDGLALSSRNRYLTPEQRGRALGLWRSLQLAQRLAAEGQRDSAIIQLAMNNALLESGVDRIDYAVLVNPRTLQPVDIAQSPTLALIAAHVGRTRLIDNHYIL